MISYILFGLGLVSLILFLVFRDKNSSTLAVCLKTSTSVFFVLTAMSSFVLNVNSSDIILPSILFIFGLVMGLIGDITLDFKIYFKSVESLKNEFSSDKDRMMWIGMVAFGIGHISYISALSILYNEVVSLLWLALLIGVLLISLVFIVATKVLKMNFGKFFVPCYLYGFLLASFVAYSLITVIKVGEISTILLLIGSILFIISDLVLSMTYFSKEEDYKKTGMMNPESRFFITVNHVTYYLAQFAIAIAILYI